MKKLFLYITIILSSSSVFAQHLPSTSDIKSKKEKMTVVVETTNLIDVLPDVTYAQILTERPVRELKMSLLIPKTNDLKPAVIYFPGGGFTTANYEQLYEIRLALAEAGFVVAAAEYRVVPNMYPALVNDGKAAIRYLKAHAKELGIDPNRIGILGDSAGGYLAQMMGTTNGEKEYDKGDFLEQNSDVQSIVSLYGISNLLNIGEGFDEKIQEVHNSPAVTEALLVNGPAFNTSSGKSIQSDSEKALKASPIGHVKKNMPPFLIMHGSADKLVSTDQSQQIYNALIKDGNKTQYIVVNDAGHGGVMWQQKPVIQKIVNWFIDTLGKPIATSTNLREK